LVILDVKIRVQGAFLGHYRALLRV
jgi:hypothetical protein